MHIIYLSLGSNLGNREQNLNKAVNEIGNRIGPVTSQSDMFVTDPYGFESVHKFINIAVCVKSELSAEEILDITQDIERQLGRHLKSVDGIYHDRTIDIDILLYDNDIIESSRLVVPHPRMKERLFVLQPLSQIAPDLIIPGERQTISDMLDYIC